METSSIEIGSSASTTFGSTARARAIATRCRCPPESSCGYFAATAAAGTSPTVSSSSSIRAADLVRGHDAMDPERAGDVMADPLDGVQRRERVLEDHLHLRAVARAWADGRGCALTSSSSSRIDPAVGS